MHVWYALPPTHTSTHHTRTHAPTYPPPQPTHTRARARTHAPLLQAVQQKRAAFSSRVPRAVPLEWVGVANEVVLMGEFDGWTQGRELSAEDVTSDTVFSRFEGRLVLRPGRYRVKLKVGRGEGGESRPAAPWHAGVRTCSCARPPRLPVFWLTCPPPPPGDGEWRLAGGWPKELDDAGNEVNVLTVD